ncbi:autotransporter domain-containing protein [Neisseria sp. Ec49-e6-T10]|uniref:autotransporter domain-containing protein n=1 Tax=Neisseria sp. Ec49-e6-T10 TaxID=3140744 RepID=UPI003EB83175
MIEKKLNRNRNNLQKPFKQKYLNGMLSILLVSGVAQAAPSFFTTTDIGSLIEGNSIDIRVSANGTVAVIRAENGAVFKYTDSGVVDLGHLGGVYTSVSAVSADGAVIVGQSTDSSRNSHAFKYTDSAGMVDLGTLGGEHSSANAVSANGLTTVGYAQTLSGNSHAYKHTDATGMVDLGHLGGDVSNAISVSADGSVIAGKSYNSQNQYHAFKHTDATGMVDLGTLSGGTSSETTAMSANGQAVVGYADNAAGQVRAFKHTDATGMVDLGSLGGDLTAAIGVSADGSVTVGQSYTTAGEHHGFKHTDATGMVDLGTLGGSISATNGVSANGKVVIGYAYTDLGTVHAFKHTDETGMIDLGTLGGSASIAASVSADGSVIGGVSTLEGDLEQHAVLWKTIDNGSGGEESENGGDQTILVDVTNTQSAMRQTAIQAQQVLDRRSARLDNLMYQDCFIGEGTICVGGYTSYSYGKRINQTDMGLTLGYQPVDQLRFGLTVDYTADDHLPNRFHQSGSRTPGLAFFSQYQQQRNGLGWQARLAAAYAKSDVEITREQLAFTEAGQADASIKGQAYSMSAGYGFYLNQAMLTPYVALQYKEVSRSAYQERNNIAFPISYSKVGEKNTSLKFGQQLLVPIAQKVKFDADIGLSVDLKNRRDAFKAYEAYLGNYIYGVSERNKIRLHSNMGFRYQPTRQIVLRLGAGWSQQSYDSDITRIDASMSYSF